MAGEISEEAKARKDLLWGMYTDLRTHARHAETLRANVVNLMIVVASILVAVIANHGRLSSTDLPLCLVVFVVGLVGLGFAASYTELYERNRKRALRIRRALDEEFFDTATPMAALLREADEQHERGVLYRRSRRVTGSTRRFWFILPSLVTAAGLLLVILTI